MKNVVLDERNQLLMKPFNQLSAVSENLEAISKSTRISFNLAFDSYYNCFIDNKNRIVEISEMLRKEGITTIDYFSKTEQLNATVMKQIYNR